MTKKVVTNDGKKGGWLVGKRHYDKGGKPLGGVKAVVTDAGGKPVELEGGEVIINREASKKHWKELSRINQSAGNGVAIEPPSGAFDEDPSEDYENGGKIEFNANHIPNKWILNYAIKIKEQHPDVWDLGGNIFGNQAFINLKRVAERGHWLDSEEWMYKKWRSFVARHKGDFRIQGVIAMLKWVDKVDKGWQYMKNLIEEEIKKREAKKSRKMTTGGDVEDNLVKVSTYILERHPKKGDILKGGKFNDYQIVEIKKITRDGKITFKLWLKNDIKRRIVTYKPQTKKISDFIKIEKGYAKGFRYETWNPEPIGGKMSDGGSVDTYNKGEVWRIGSVDYYFDESYIDNNGVKKWKTYKVFSTPRDKYTGIISIILSKTITDKRLKEFPDVGKKYGMDVTPLFDIKYKDGGSTPAPLKDRIKGSKFNEKGTASTSSKAESIKFDDNTIASIQSLIGAHNEKYPSKKITLAVAKAVVRRGMGAYSSSHRTTITGGKPNSRTAWGLARLKAFIYKAQTGKSKSGKYSQDNDLFEELNISVQKMSTGGVVTTYGGEANVGDKGQLNTRKGRINIEITNITDKWVIFNDLTEGGKRKDTPRDKFIENYRGNAPLGSSVQSQQAASIAQPTQTPAKQWTADDFKNTKIIVDTPEKSKKFQELIFSLGGKWGELDVPKTSLRKKIHFTDEQYLLVGSDLVFFYFSKFFSWDDSSKKEIFYDDIFGATSTQQTATSKPAPGKWTANDFKNTKIIVDKEQSEKLQKYIFKLGAEWGDGSKKVELTSFEYMYIDDDLKMKVSTVKDTFDKDPSKQIFFDDIFKSQTTKSTTSTSTASLNDYRIKTEAEFKSEFGTDWRSEVKWTKPAGGGMDWLFGKRLSEITVIGKEKDNYESVLSNSVINTDVDKDPNSNYAWPLNAKTWIYDPVSPQQTESKPEYVLKKPLKRKDLYDIKITVDTPEKSEAFQKAAFGLGFNWPNGKQDIINAESPYLFIDKEFSTEYEFGFGNVKNKDFYQTRFNKELFFDDLFELKGSKTSTIDVEPVVEKQNDIKSEKDLLVEQYNDVLFLISVTPTTDTENMLSLKARARELKDAIDLIDLELRKKAQTELTLLDELFDASTIKPQERYKFMRYTDGFAPDGQPTALPKNVYNWTMSEEFQNWFGNFTLAYNYRNSSYENVPCSVIVNKNYEPLIVYHGTGSEFSFFKFDSFPAMYFAENEAYSNWFAEMKGQQNGTQGYVYPFVLNMRTPLDLTLFETNKISAAEFIDWMYLQTGLDENELKVNKALLDPSVKNQAWVYLRNSPEMLKVLRDKNVCDGIIYYEDNPSVDVSSLAYMTKAYIVFNANSAKIANNERHIQTIPAMRSFFLKRGGKL